MKQADLGLNRTMKRTRKREFRGEMERVGPWAALVALITPDAPEGRRGCPPLAVETMLRVHSMQQWFTLRYRRWKKHCTTCHCSGSLPG